MILVLDNRDSFVFNLARCIHLLGVEVRVVPSHGTTVDGIRRLGPRALVISPGPCTPAEAGCSVDAIRELRGRLPMLGVCLGHQAIAAALGGRVIRATEPVHGRTSAIHHDGTDLFAGLPSPMPACRYHSLVIDDRQLPSGLVVTARTDDGTVMAVAHRADRLHGVQFHPESILTAHGFHLLANFLDLAAVPWQADIAAIERQQGPLHARDEASAGGDAPVVTF